MKVELLIVRETSVASNLGRILLSPDLTNDQMKNAK